MSFESIAKVSAENKCIATVLYFPTGARASFSISSLNTGGHGLWQYSTDKWMGCFGSGSIIYFLEITEDLPRGASRIDLAYFSWGCLDSEIVYKVKQVGAAASLIFKTTCKGEFKVLGPVK